MTNVSINEDTFIEAHLLHKFDSDFKLHRHVFNEKSQTLLALDLGKECQMFRWATENGIPSTTKTVITWGSDLDIMDLSLLTINDKQRLIVSTRKEVNEKLKDEYGIPVRKTIEPKLWESDCHIGGDNLTIQLDTSMIKCKNTFFSLSHWKNFLIVQPRRAKSIHVYEDLKYCSEVSIPYSQNVSLCTDKIIFSMADDDKITVHAWSFKSMRVGTLLCELPGILGGNIVLSSGKILARLPKTDGKKCSEFHLRGGREWLAADAIVPLVIYDGCDQKSRTVLVKEPIGKIVSVYKWKSKHAIVSESAIYEMR